MTTSEPTETEVPYRQHRVLSTLNVDGSRRRLRPRVSTGRYLTRRRGLAYGLIALFTAIPLIRISGKPAILLDVAQREFTLFGTTFFPTDTLLLTFTLLSAFALIFLVTALYGRVWCGWACPQTVYLEFVFRPLERLFDGPPNRRGELALPPVGWRIALKYLAYLLISFLLANLFLAYFVGIDRLSVWVRRSPLEHPGSFLVVASTTALMMFNFAWFREQTCILACPYGRLQSVLFDRQTLIVGYDNARGEPRGRLQKSSAIADQPQPAAAAGDCVDCGLCVVTCPTGIDIRDGLQLECVGCTQCIDACDTVMDRIHRPRGLIRYCSQSELQGGARRFRARLVVYYALLGTLLTACIAFIATRGEAEVTVTRGLGMPYTILPDGRISNSLRIRIANRTAAPAAFRIEPANSEAGQLLVPENPMVVGPRETRVEAVTIVFAFPADQRPPTPFEIRISDDRGFRRNLTYTLLTPAAAPTAVPPKREQP